MIVWITGKGPWICGNINESPHFQVYNAMNVVGHPGIYHGDEERENEYVFNLATDAIGEMTRHDNFLAFIHFRDPDYTGHMLQDYDAYMEKAFEVDEYIFQLMRMLPQDTDVIYCSDHGFNFIGQGEVESNHRFCPWGMVATNFPTANVDVVEQTSIGRMIYRRSGGDPDLCKSTGTEYRMYGIDLV